MQNLRIKVEVDNWNKACKYLKDPAAGLDVGEESAIEQLADFWRTRSFSKGLSDESAELLDVLKSNIKRYSSNNKKTTEQLQAFIGIAKNIYCKDQATYDAYVAELRAFHNVRKTPTQKPPTRTPKPVPVETPQPVKSVLRILSVDFADSSDSDRKFGLTLPTTTQYIQPRVKYSIEPAPKTPIDISYRIFSPKGEMEKNSEYPDGFLGSQKLTYREGTVQMSGWGNTMGTAYYEGKWRFELYSDSKLIYTTYFNIKSPFSHTPPSIDIQKVDFANANYDGVILNDYGTRLPVNTQYLKPRLHYTVRNRENREIDIRYKIYDPFGKLLINPTRSDNYAVSTNFKLSWESPATLVGFGNKEGDCYFAGQYRVEIYENDYLLYTTSVDIGASQPTSKIPRPVTPPPTISSKKTSDSSSGGCLATIVGTAIVIAVIFGVMKWCGRDTSKDNAVDTDRYVMASQVFLRSTPNSASNSNIITKFPYGTRFSCIGETDGWLEVQETQTGKTGFVAQDYVISTKDFNHLDSIWGSRNIIDEIPMTRHRQALLNLYKEMSPKMGGGYFMIHGPSNNWMEKNLKDGYDNYPEFAFIVQDAETGNRKTAIYSFLPDESPLLRHVEDAPAAGGIKNISYNTGKGFSITYGSRRTPSKKAKKKEASTVAVEEVTGPINVEEVPLIE